MEKNKYIGAWKNKSKEGKTYISFTIDGKKYSMFPNQYKETDKQPDFNILESKPVEKKEDKHDSYFDIPF